ncbi:MAG: methylamine utilization protein [Zetaproteobacteria bacterium]|nr:MAG: methylamine utilization protein [Zetaproteobacteria bacterium]
MNTTRWIIAGCLAAGAWLAPVGAQAEDLSDWVLPPVPVPADNPQSKAKIALGHQLVFDPRLSKNDSISCAGCHLPFAGGGGHTPRAFGHGGELGRWAPSWVNAAYYTSLFWDGRAASLEEQTGALPGHMGPISAPGEMGGDVPAIVARLKRIPGYDRAFRKVFKDGVTRRNIARAIAAYERTLVARDAPFQRYVRGDRNAISAAAKRGFALFRGKAQCVACHTPPLLTDNAFHNIGVPQVGPLKEDKGRYAVTGDKDDIGAFKTPTLYNSASLLFFMHDGAFSTMEQVIDHYNRGGNPKDPRQDDLIEPLHLTAAEQADLIAFLETLTDPRLNRIHRPALP